MNAKRDEVPDYVARAIRDAVRAGRDARLREDAARESWWEFVKRTAAEVDKWPAWKQWF
jgi:hypothetical protein